MISAFKRLDIDRDSKVTFTEFKRLFNSPTIGTLNPSKNGSKASTFYESAGSRGFETTKKSPLRSPYRSPLRNTIKSPNRTLATRYLSPLRFTSPLKERTLNLLNRSAEKFNFASGKSPEKNKTGSRFTISSNLGRSLRNSEMVSSANQFVTYEEENFQSYLRELIDLENEIENAKCDLVTKADFNIEDAFRIFELSGRGYLGLLEIKYGLNFLDIYPSEEEIYLLVKRYNLGREGFLR